MRAVEEAFETLRSAGLCPDARSAFGAILDHVMNDFDAPQSRWAERAKYRYLVERLAGDRPLAPLEQLGNAASGPAPIARGHHPTYDAATTHVPKQVEGCADDAFLIPNNRLLAADVSSPSPSASPSDTDFASLIETKVEAAVKRAMLRPGSQDLLSSRIPTFIAKKREELGDKAKHLADYPGRIGVFIAIAGDKPIGDYGKEDMERFRDVVDQIPVKAKQRFRTDDPHLQIRMNSELAIPIQAIDPVTVDAKYLSPIKVLFNHLVSLGIIERSPLEGICSRRVKGEDGVDIDVSEERLPFEPHHILALRAIADRKPKNSPDYWWIRVLPRAGLRLDEFAVLSPFDIRQINGRWCIDLLHFDDGDPAHRERRKELDLKTASSRRIVPIHPALIADGFLEFVEQRRRRDGDRVQLFPQCKPDKYGCYSSSLSKRLARQIDQVVSNKRYVTHSTRHNFAAACDAAGVPVAVREKFLGHAVEEEKSNGRSQRSRNKLKRRYGTPIPSIEEMDWIENLNF